MREIFLRYISLPPNVKGLTVQDAAGDYNIYVNSRLTYESRQEALQHEMQHISGDDFSKDTHIRGIENQLISNKRGRRGMG